MRPAKFFILLGWALALAGCAAPPAPAAAPTASPPPAVATPTRAVEAAPTVRPAPTEAPLTAAPSETPPVPTTAPLVTGAFIKEEVDVKGSFTLDLETNTLRFSDDFAVPPGPDLFVVLSGAGDLTVNYQTFSQLVVNAPLLRLGKLQKQVGAQDYALPAGTDLALYKTVVIWCESFSVAFAAAPLALPLY